MKIHSSAVVDSAAVIADGVEIGPFSVVGAGAVLAENVILQSHTVLEGVVRIGANTVVGHGSIIGGLPQDLGFKPGTASSVLIGERNIVREHCTIHRGTAEGSVTTIGDRNFLMAGVHVGHNCTIRHDVIIANNSLLGGYVEVGDRAFIGGGSVFHQHTRVGRLVMTQGNSGIGKDIPPFLVAAEVNLAVGLNVVGMRRAGLSAAERDDAKRAFKLLYRSGLNTRQALDRAANEEAFGPLAREFFEFIAQARQRGIVAYRQVSANDG